MDVATSNAKHACCGCFGDERRGDMRLPRHARMDLIVVQHRPSPPLLLFHAMDGPRARGLHDVSEEIFRRQR